MRRIFLAPAAFASAGLALLVLGGAGQPAPRAPHPSYSDTQQTELDQISDKLNTIRTLESGFLQIGPQGQADQGELYLEKPGKVRFSYNPPSPVLVVATGGTVYVKNSKLNTVEHYDVTDTPLPLLLTEKIDLKTNPAVMGIEKQGDTLVVAARTSRNRNRANVHLFFDAPSLELRQWTIVDNQGGTTTVALQQPQTGVTLAPSLFAVPVKTPPGANQQSRN